MLGNMLKSLGPFDEIWVSFGSRYEKKTGWGGWWPCLHFNATSAMHGGCDWNDGPSRLDRTHIGRRAVAAIGTTFGSRLEAMQIGRARWLRSRNDCTASLAELRADKEVVLLL
jgi:hypothetical protein